MRGLDRTTLERQDPSPQVRLVGADGEQIGVVATQEAVRRARELDLDLVEVAPQANPPVCRIMDYGKFKYERDIRQKEARKKQADRAQGDQVPSQDRRATTARRRATSNGSSGAATR